MSGQGDKASGFAEKLLAGDRVTLGRAINAVENDTGDARQVLSVIREHLGRAQVIGITGAPGSGKSTLVNALVREYRAAGKSVGVVAVDPSSPLSGGAILGDRIRMSEHSSDTGVFVRSVASRGHLGGLSRTTVRVIDVMDAAGKDVIIVETVGTGQSEVEVMEIVETVVVVCAPGLGDEIQAVKAGILEIADILVVNKGDSPLATRTERELKDAAVFHRDDGWKVPVLRTTATEGEGVGELVEAVAGHRANSTPEGDRTGARRRTKRLMINAASELVRDRLIALDTASLDALVESLLSGEIDIEEAAGKAARIAVEKT